MKRNPESLPTPFGQVSGFLRVSASGVIDTLSRRGRFTPDRLLINTVYKGLNILIPERLNTLKDPERTALMADLLSYMIYRNEELDLSYSWREGNASTGRILKEVVLPLLAERSEALKNPSRRNLVQEEGIDVLLNTCDREIDFIEDVANKKYRSGNPQEFTYQDSLEYRGAVNAIYTGTVIGAFLGAARPDVPTDPALFALRQKLQPIEGELTYEKILDKYRWVMDDNPKQSNATSSKLDKVFSVMYNLAMAGQVDDDWYGRHVDKILGVPSMALVSLRDNNQDRRKARKQLLKTRKMYMKRLTDLHFSRLGTFAAVRGQELAQMIGHMQLGIMRKRGRTKEMNEMKLLGIKKIPVYPRDSAYADGQLQ